MRRRIEAPTQQLPPQNEGTMQVFKVNPYDVKLLAFGPDHRVVLSCCSAKSVFWEPASLDQASQPRIWGELRGSYPSVALDADVKTLAMTSLYGPIRIWDLLSGRRIQVLDESSLGAKAIAFSPDNTQVAASCADGNIRVWETGSAGVRHIFKRPAGLSSAEGLAFHPTGTMLAAVGARLALFSLRSGMRVPRVGGLTAATAVAFHPNGRLLAAGDSAGHIAVWSLPSGRQLWRVRAHLEAVTALQFHPSEEVLACGSQDRTVQLWDVETAKPVALRRGHEHAVTALCFSPDGAILVTGDQDGHVGVASLRADANSQGQVERPDLVSRATALSAAASISQVTARSLPFDASLMIDPTGGRYALMYPDGRVTLHSTESDGGRDVLTLRKRDLRDRHFYLRGDFLVSTSLRRTATSDHHQLHLWDLTGNRAPLELKGHRDFVNGVALSPDGRLLASSAQDGTVRCWDLTEGRVISTERMRSTWPRHPAFSPNGRQLFWHSANAVRCRDFAQQGPLQKWATSTRGIYAVSPDGRFVAISAAWDNAVRVWDIAVQKPVALLETLMPCDADAISFSGDGSNLAAAVGDGRVYVWDISTGSLRFAWQGPEGRGLELQPASGGGILVWTTDFDEFSVWRMD